MASWTEYVVAAQILQDTELWTLPLGLKSFESNMGSEWGLYGAASVIVTIPVVVLFLSLSRWLVSGLTLGSVKGMTPRTSIGIRIMDKPRLSFWQIWNMSFGFFGIQFGWGLQMANMSAIYQYLGAERSRSRGCGSPRRSPD